MRRIVIIAGVAAALLSWACDECLGPSHNRAVPPPGNDEYQLVMDNWLSRKMPVYVDGEEVAKLCEESDLVVVGNFPVSQCTHLQVFEEVNYQRLCDLTPCGGYICLQECPTFCHDTRPYAGRQFDKRMCWEGQCDESTK